MKRILIFILFLLFLYPPFFLYPEKLGEFNQYFDWSFFGVDEDQVYIIDRAEQEVYIFRKDDLRLIRKFGRFGQGPSDFEGILLFKVFPDYLFFNDISKVAYYSKKGDLLKTIKTPGNIGHCLPLGQNFVTRKYLPSDPSASNLKVQLMITNTKFKKEKKLHYAEYMKINIYTKPKNTVMLINDCFKYDVFDDKLYIGNTAKGFYFVVYNAKGELLYEIDRPYTKRKITLQDKRKYFKSLKKGFGEKKFNLLRNKFDYKFPEFFPAFSDFIVASDKIYTLGYEKDGYIDVFILELKGNLLRKVKLPSIGDQNRFYTIHDNKFYYLLYNEANFKMELHMEKIE